MVDREFQILAAGIALGQAAAQRAADAPYLKTIELQRRLYATNRRYKVLLGAEADGRCVFEKYARRWVSISPDSPRYAEAQSVLEQINREMDELLDFMMGAFEFDDSTQTKNQVARLFSTGNDRLCSDTLSTVRGLKSLRPSVVVYAVFAHAIRHEHCHINTTTLTNMGRITRNGRMVISF